MNLLQVDNLRIHYPGASQPAVDDLSFSVDAGDTLGIVGESGSGKTQTALAIMGLLPPRAHVQGSVRFDGSELVGKGNKLLNRFRARRIAMVFQDPQLALNPYLKIGQQIRRVLLEHRLARRGEARRKAIALLARVRLPDPERQFSAYPHELSGGMRQRAMIALALAGEPDVLIADEPTTALDVTVQAQILNLMRDLRAQSGIALLLITHDLGIIAENCDRLVVMHCGRMLEQGATREVFRNPAHRHTRLLIDAAPRLDGPLLQYAPAAGGAAPLLGIEDLSVDFRETNALTGVLRRGRSRKAVRSLSLTVARGETLAIVGESGSGKTSLARAIVGLLAVESGSVRFAGRTLAGRVEARPVAVRRRLQMVFQDPMASLNPAMRVSDIIAEPFRLCDPRQSSAARDRQVADMLQRVGLDEGLAPRFPHELSGGQAQRVAIARALVPEPQVLICDEAVAALDGRVRRDVLDLLRSEQQRSGMSVIFITHDLAVVRQISHRVLVMYMGRICESGPAAGLFDRPQHPYTRALLDAVPIPDPARKPRRARITGDAASLFDPPSGCAFHPRCTYALNRCKEELPELRESDGGEVACHRAAELDLR